MTVADTVEINKSRNYWLSKGFKKTVDGKLTRPDMLIARSGKCWKATDLIKNTSYRHTSLLVVLQKNF
ncbi:hypothetical protein SAMN02744783_04751 [Serratia sp. CC22-02]|nr:hypothetical protein SAMN02744783_04751 [Serratia sp. CC22-02]